MVVTQETIVGIIKQNGPLLPAQLAKVIGTNILIASAHLSDLTDRKVVFISNTKVGGSPVYYIQGQEAKLQDFVSNLDKKDQETFELLKGKKVLQDNKLDQLTRVSLRTIKDFAVPLQVTKDNEKILFWKWYLFSNKEAEELIKKSLEVDVKKEEKEQTQIKSDLLEKEKVQLEEERLKLENERLQQKEKQKNIEEKRKIENERKKIEDERKKLQKERIELRKHLEEERQIMLKEIKKTTKPVKIEDEFLDQLNLYFEEKKIKIVDTKVIRKKSEIELILKVPSVVGDLEYYCKAKNKKSINDADLSSAVIQGQLKKLPVLFLATGDLTKKAQELLNTDFKKGIVINKIQDGNKS